MMAVLAVANAMAWLGAWTLFGDRPVLVGTAALAYGLGLRHAVDADHIAAIDNATRKMMEVGRRPVAARPVLLARALDGRIRPYDRRARRGGDLRVAAGAGRGPTSRSSAPGFRLCFWSWSRRRT